MDVRKQERKKERKKERNVYLYRVAKMHRMPYVAGLSPQKGH